LGLFRAQAQWWQHFEAIKFVRFGAQRPDQGGHQNGLEKGKNCHFWFG
jgi:hypothetical protein